ncbi:MAG TPA: hypothetical protein VFO85_16830, partial [Vicinamibacteria bacterium]|nr:hypothetical protein [Vicinamibacteria bacterium]
PRPAPRAPEPAPPPVAAAPPAPAPRAPEPARGPAPARDTAGAAGDPEVLLAGMLARCRPTLAQPLRSAQVRQEGDVLVLEVPAELAAYASLHESEYRDLAKEAAGRAVKLRVQAGQVAPEDPTEPSRRTLLDEAMKEPAVREAVDLFGGKVVQVRPGKSQG